ncbi:MAG: tyrosine-type recombinase/integrase [Halothiobacillaceae bacterium]
MLDVRQKCGKTRNPQWNRPIELIGGANKRHRRPTEDELARIMAWLAEHKGARYAGVVAFTEATALRQGEISALKLSDINFETHVAKVWRKHPRLGKKLHEVPILGEAWAILNRQQPEDGRPFPIHGGTMSKYFHRSLCRSVHPRPAFPRSAP